MAVFQPSARLMEAIETEVRDRGFRLKHLTRGVGRLSDKFVNRNGPLGEYLLLPEQLASYTAYYAPVNVMKVRWVLEELKLYAPDFLSQPKRVLDFGSGPGSALLGLAEVSQEKHQTVAVDTVAPALEMAATLVGKVSPFSVEVAPMPPPDRYDLIFAANVYSELEDSEEILQLLGQLEPTGYLVLIEPALKETTLKVMELRDKLAEEGWTIAAPCLDVPSCPMRAHDFWCTMDVKWTRPASIQKLDDRTGLDKEALKFSYLVVTKEGARRTGSARVVSHMHREKGKVWAWLCGGSEELCRTELLKRDKGEHNLAFKHARRGDVLEIDGFTSGKQARLTPGASVRKT